MNSKEYNLLNINQNILTTRSDEIARLDYGVYRALLSCGHACDPNSLTSWCKSLLDDGKTQFTCPAMKGSSKCNQEWDYSEVRLLGLLTQQEMDYFETKLNENMANQLFDFKKCPKCISFIEREENSCNLETECKICNFKFCWLCESKWNYKKAINSNRFSCGRSNCQNKELQILSECKMIKLISCPKLEEIPSIRACPKCFKILEHNGLGCKNIICKQCSTEFCFACLQNTIDCQKSSPGHYNICSIAVASKQTFLKHYNKYKF